MRRLIVPIAITLALATGAVLAETRMVLQPPPIGALQDDRAANAELVRRWYEAANWAIRTGDAAGLAGLVAPSFVSHAEGTVGAGSTALAEYLAGLHATHPRAQLVVLDVTAETDRVVARVQVTGALQGQFLGVPVTGARVWGAVDFFRIANGQVAEHWTDGTSLASFDPLMTVSLTVQPPTRKLVTLERWTFPPGHSELIASTGWNAVVFVETGQLRLATDRFAARPSWRVIRSLDGAASPQPVAPGTSAILNDGDIMLMGNYAKGTIANDGESVAVALIVTVAAGDEPSFVSKGFGSGSPGDIGAALRSTSPAAGTGSAIVEELVADGPAADLPAGDVLISIGRTIMTPAGGIPPHTVPGVELLSVESGTLMLSANDAAAWVHRRAEDGSSLHETTLLNSGDGALIRACSKAHYRSVADDPLQLLLVTIAPATPEVDATPPNR